MAEYQHKGCLTYKDENGDLHRMYPTTYKECVKGLDGVDAHISSKSNPHAVSPGQIGAVATADVATISEVKEYLGIETET